ncbi:MAG TPA: prepilin-type N-terminal cleavage/methylation domain-containing protein [Verrucomicrobiae bacterium]|nr:prepilin-type N-terminal cleavage/methylation domain-containing protein [Verrucomicrobiae bacterium]
MRRKGHNTDGFTLVELMVSLAIGTLLLGSAVMMYRQAVNATWVTSQKAEMQQDFRAAANLLQRDISLAGSGGLGQQGLAANSTGLPTGAGSIIPVYPCSATTCNYIKGAPVAFPTVAGAPYLYSIIPGYNLGITVNATEGPTDIITVAYADTSLALNCYNITVQSATQVLFQAPSSPLPTCVLPTGVSTIPLLNAAGIGLQAGDMILFGQTAAGIVSNITTATPTTGNSSAFTVTFNSGDPGHINQPTVASGTMKQLPLGLSATLSAVRVMMITYYLDISPVDGVTPRLMRIQSGKAPVPVAENVTYLKFSYDVDNGGTINTNQASLPAGTTPNMITKVNILHMSIRSQLQGGGYQGLDLQTSIGARNLTMGQEYPISGSSY